MNAIARTIVSVWLASAAISLMLALVGSRVAATWAVVPAVAVGFLAFAGHAVTLDEDAPGGWSNPGASREVWRASLRELSAKLLAIVLPLFLVACYWMITL
jgi:hypothetical protein